MIEPHTSWPQSFKDALHLAGFIVDDEACDILWGCVHKAAIEWKQTLRTLMQEAEVEFDDAAFELLLTSLANSVRKLKGIEVEDNYRNGRIANDNIALMKLLREPTTQDMIQYLLRGLISYSQWHSIPIEELEIVETRWGSNDELIIRFSKD